MNIYWKPCLAALTIAFSATGGWAAGSSTELWYNAPAKEWMEALPLGNGRLGTMVYGGMNRDRIALN